MLHATHTTTQQRASAMLAMLAAAPWAYEPGPTDDDINQMARWHAEREFGAFAIESDAYDKDICHG